jgi:hypothetical protein
MTIDAPALAPLVNSAQYDELEAELKQVFLDLFATYLRASERDLNVVGAAHLGSLALLEKCIKQDGLAVFGDDTFAVQYLYRAWHARNPKRGMIFLKTYLQLIWPNGWIVDQMWQDKRQPYPTALVARSDITDSDPTTNYFMTSRIVVSIADDAESGVNIPRVAPALRSALAARFLLEIRNLRQFANADTNGIGVGTVMYGEQLAMLSGQAVAPPGINALHVLVNQTLPSPSYW